MASSRYTGCTQQIEGMPVWSVDRRDAHPLKWGPILKNLAWMISLGLWGFLLAGCAGPADATDAPMSPTALPSAVLAAADMTQRPMPAGECFWGAAVEVWEDTDGDGRQ